MTTRPLCSAISEKENGNMAVNCSSVKMLGEHMPKLIKKSVSEQHEEIDISPDTRLTMVDGYLYIERACCTIDGYLTIAIRIPSDFLYTEFQRALHPEEEVPLNANHVNYPVGSIYTSFCCKTTAENLAFLVNELEPQSKQSQYEATSELFFGYHTTKRGSYYYLENYSFAIGMTGDEMIIRMGKRQMEMVLQFLRRHLCQFK